MENQILLNYDEKAHKELLEKQTIAKSALKSLIDYCEETLRIKIANIKSLYADPINYCIDEYWKKYGLQYGDAPIKKEKAIEMTAWNEGVFQQYLSSLKSTLNSLASNQYEIDKNEIKFFSNEEDFKTYVLEEDRETYELTLQFIKIAEEMQKKTGVSVIDLARRYETIAISDQGHGDKLIPSNWYFSHSPQFRRQHKSVFGV